MSFNDAGGVRMAYGRLAVRGTSRASSRRGVGLPAGLRRPITAPRLRLRREPFAPGFRLPRPRGQATYGGQMRTTSVCPSAPTMTFVQVPGGGRTPDLGVEVAASEPSAVSVAPTLSATTSARGRYT